tara:strand:+ start:6401 stop:8821 length:2421 start_codon:yes stop_codon:yes gene_type:complete
MATELEITKQMFYSDYHNMYSTEQIALEDARFLIFTEFLDETDVFNSPVVSRKEGAYKKGKWGVLGYCCNSYRRVDDEEETDDEIDQGPDEEDDKLEFQWEYTLFNGFFSDDIGVVKATKLEITKAINEVTRFIEKTFSPSLINDVCEAKDLQAELLKQNKNNALERLDICIITDKVIDQEKLDTKVFIENLNLECRIYYWDLKRWNDLKRSKSKREAINIDFQDKEFSIYNVDYLERKVNDKLSYYLAVFPGDLIADLYDYHNTRLLENNVRVFLSANRKANKAIRETIKIDTDNFFSYNNGISATAESVIIKDSRIIKINDFQIVNGGQTTATIHHSRKTSGLDLKKVFVAVKITALKKDKEYGKTVSNISKAANTQTSIKPSDFYANDPLLIGIERLSLKNPVLNYDSHSISYYFERMAGQYNVTKNSRGTNRNIKIWELKHPKKLSYNKVDVARWYNTMEELPHISVLSAEKQFTNFMDEKDFERKEISIGIYKTLVGFGMLCQRARKLCGTKKGRDYPSIIGDSSVGMATTIYAMAYLHYITGGCLDYWGIYNYKYGVCDALVEKKRKESELDDILESVIKACWVQIEIFGGSSAQEQTKNVKCWEHVKANIEINDNVIKQLENFTITLKEKKSRESEIQNEEDVNYFAALNFLLKNNASILKQLLIISASQSVFRSENTMIKNQIKKIQLRKNILTKKRVEQISAFYRKLKKEGYNFNAEVDENDLKIDIKCDLICDEIFSDRVSFLKKCDQFTLDHEADFEDNYNLREEIIEIIEKYDREYGLSVNDFLKLEKGLKFIN